MNHKEEELYPDGQDQLPSKELESRKVRFFSVALPDQPDAYGPMVHPYFDPHRVTANIYILNDLVKRIEDDPDRFRHQGELLASYGLMKHIIQLYIRFEKTLPKLVGAESVIERLQSAGYVVDSSANDSPKTTAEVSAEILTQLWDATDELVLLSPSHLSGFPESEAMHQLVSEQGGKIGVIVLDRHTDFYSKGDAELHKGSFLRYSMEENHVQAVSILGVAQYLQHSLEHKDGVFNPQSEYYPTAEFYHAHKNQIHLTSDAQLYGVVPPNKESRSFNKEQFLQSLNEAFQLFKKNGVTHVFVQLDPDVLRLDKIGYTVPDYTSINYLLNLGIQDLSKVKSLKIPQALHEATALASGLGSTGNFLQGLRFGENPSASVGIPLSAVGMTLSMLAHQGTEMGFSFGIELPNGGAHVLSITELANPDVDGRMTRAIKNIANMVPRLRKEVG